MAAIERANGRRNLKVLDAAIAIHLGGGAGRKSRAELRFRDTDVEQRPRYVLERLASHVSRVPSLHGHDGGVL